MEMSAEKERIMERIAKCLTLANDQAGKPEGENARRMAMRDMAKYSIKESEIDLEKGKGVESDYIFEDEDGWEGLNDQGGRRDWVSALASSIAITFGGRVWISGRGKGTVHFLATAGDLETCLYFMDVIFEHIEKLARKTAPAYDDYKKRNIFGQAAWQEVDRRLMIMKREMAEAYKEFEGGSALMVLKSGMVARVVEDVFKQRGYGKATSNWVKSSDQKLINAGRLAGKSAPLHRGIEQ